MARKDIRHKGGSGLAGLRREMFDLVEEWKGQCSEAKWKEEIIKVRGKIRKVGRG